MLLGACIVFAPILWMVKTDRLTQTVTPRSPKFVEQYFVDLPPALQSSRHSMLLKPLAIFKNTGIGGALAADVELILFVNRAGEFQRLENGRFEPFELPAPFDISGTEAFFKATFAKTTAGVKDLVIKRREDGWEFFVSGLDHIDHNCVSIKIKSVFVSEFELQNTTALSQKKWEELYVSNPCLKIESGLHPIQSGGAIALGRNDTLFLATGNFAIGDTPSDDNLAQRHDSDYGKTIAIHLIDGSNEIISKGHRNPSGLIANDEGEMWTVEHGPRGGDALHLIQSGANYGWPLETYGTAYDGFAWPPDSTSTAPDRLTFNPPMFAWVPSIAPSDIIQIKGEGFTAWKGDLLVSSLKSRSLFRIRIRDGAVKFVEPIYIGKRIRNMVETADGRILLQIDREDAVLSLTSLNSNEAEVARAPKGLGRCSACHKVNPDQIGEFSGPSLVDVFDRKIAVLPGYNYSDALRKIPGRWTDKTLHAFLENPAKFAQGTTMPALDLSFSDRTIIIEALKQIPNP